MARGARIVITSESRRWRHEGLCVINLRIRFRLSGPGLLEPWSAADLMTCNGRAISLDTAAWKRWFEGRCGSLGWNPVHSGQRKLLSCLHMHMQGREDCVAFD